MLTADEVRKQVDDLERFLAEEYKPQHLPQKRDWRTYEQQRAVRIRQVMRNSVPSSRRQVPSREAPDPDPSPP